MAEENNPIYLDTLVVSRQLSAAAPVGKMGDRLVVPLEGEVKGKSSYMSASGSAGAVADTSMTIRYGAGAFGKQVGGDAFVSLPVVMFIGAGAVGVVDSVNNWQRARDIGDGAGQDVAVISGVENSAISVGATAFLGLKTLGGIQEVSTATHHAISTAGAFSAAQGAFSWMTGILFGIFYIANAIRNGYGLVSWLRASGWREQLMKENDPVQAIFKELKTRSYQVDMTFEEEIELALETGAKWLEKVEGESGGQLTITDKKEAFRNLVMNRPETIRELIGGDGRQLSGKQELIRFGRYMAYKNLCTQFEEECARKLGSGAVEAIKKGDAYALKTALGERGWVIPALKVSVAALGLIAVVVGTVLSGGIALGVVLFLGCIAGVGMIVLGDWQVMMDHLQKGHFNNLDRFFVYSALVLGVISLVGGIALTVITGGVAPFLVSLILSVVWLGINARSAYLIWQFDRHNVKPQEKEEKDYAELKRLTQEVHHRRLEPWSATSQTFLPTSDLSGG